MDEIVIETFFLFHIFSYTGKARFLIQAFFFFFFGTTRYVPNYVPPLPYRGRYHQREKKREKEREREKKRKTERERKERSVWESSNKFNKNPISTEPHPRFRDSRGSNPIGPPYTTHVFFPPPNSLNSLPETRRIGYPSPGGPLREERKKKQPQHGLIYERELRRVGLLDSNLRIIRRRKKTSIHKHGKGTILKTHPNETHLKKEK